MFLYVLFTVLAVWSVCCRCLKRFRVLGKCVSYAECRKNATSAGKSAFGFREVAFSELTWPFPERTRDFPTVHGAANQREAYMPLAQNASDFITHLPDHTIRLVIT